MNKTTKRWLKVLSLLMAVCLLSLSPADLFSYRAEAATQSELQQQLEDLEAEEDRLNDSIAVYKDDLAQQQAYLDTINDKIANAVGQIEVLTDQLTDISNRIAAKEVMIAEKQQEIMDREQEIEDDFAKLQERLRAISKTGNMSTLQMLLNTDEYTDYLIKSKMMQRIAKNDQELMDELEKEIARIREEQKSIEAEKAEIDKEWEEVAAIKEKADAKKADLDALHAQANRVAKDLQNSIDGYKEQLADNQARKEQVEQDLQALIQQSTGSSGGGYTGSYGGGSMHWPVPAVRNVSSGYGYRWGTIHRGIDISEGAVPIYGQNIVAAADGKVIYVNNTSWWGTGASWGYGYCVIIDHGTDAYGNTVTTLYAHCSRVNVYVGQEVTGGSTVIAAAGNSGDVTGPHLHFEVRLNGSAVDPISNGYLSG